jgi:phage-related protein
MLTFPKLKTGAVAQYPATKTVQFRTQALRFVDGSEQRYREGAGALHRWTIRLESLDEGEMAAVENFVRGCQGRLATFSFTDPWDGAVYGNCSLESDELAMEWTAEMQGRTTVTVVENRS